MGDASEKNGTESEPGWRHDGVEMTLHRVGSLTVVIDEYGTTFPSEAVADLITGATWRSLCGRETPYAMADAVDWTQANRIEFLEAERKALREQLAASIIDEAEARSQVYAFRAEYADMNGELPSHARFRMVTPDRWNDIVRDSFVFGQVAATAFAAYAPVRMTRDGFLFEATEAELGDEDLQRIGDKLDRAAGRAFEQRAALDVARTVVSGPAATTPSMGPFVVRREDRGYAPPWGEDLGCYATFDAANDAARSILLGTREEEVGPPSVYDRNDRLLTQWYWDSRGSRVKVRDGE